jgi:predicted deacylase
MGALIAHLGPGVHRTSERIARLPDGAEVSIPIVVIKGQRPGPTLYLQAGLHGDEVTGIQILTSTIGRMNPDAARGTIIAVPVANPLAYITRSRGYALEERGPIDLNRIFPGSEHGLSSERIAYYLFTRFVSTADLTVDIHSALSGCDIYPFTYIDPDDDESKTLQLRTRLARALGTPMVYHKARGSKLGTSAMTGSIATQADAVGKPVLSLEMGESGRVSAHRIEGAVSGVMNMMRAYGVLDGEAFEQPEQTRFSHIAVVHSEHAGLLTSKVELGQKVEPGQALAAVTDPMSGRRWDVTATAAGTVLRLMRMSPIGTGAEVAWVVS